MLCTRIMLRRSRGICQPSLRGSESASHHSPFPLGCSRGTEWGLVVLMQSPQENLVCASGSMTLSTCLWLAWLTCAA